MIIIRRIEKGEYSVLPEIEDMAGEIFLQAGIDLSHFSSTPSTYYESLDKESSGIFVAVKEEEIVGFCYTTTVDNNGYLGEMSVIPQYTRQGIGTKLLHRAIDWTREKNYRFLLLKLLQTFRSMRRCTGNSDLKSSFLIKTTLS